MHSAESLPVTLHHRLVDSLYVEAMVMADEARAYFDRKSDTLQQGGDVMARLSFTCESLKVTTRLMHIIAWLLTQRAWQRGEITREALADPKYRLGEAAATDPAVLADLPAHARALVTGSQDLYARVLRLQTSGSGSGQDDDNAPAGAARGLLDRLHQAF
ncbi:DUF1465 family protein [Sphingobium subterraneum]|uniref:Regulator of CtrA degradation n=1 Tax=Sphingobium subterraneum TaxID=627688 RepID=A0A841J3M2_9SPHN|nr:DUF1465 family protein [Sphingobium subterraneum]MBB6123118.1 regulator of CtrA degradation [Sphingobium subterraneum]